MLYISFKYIKYYGKLLLKSILLLLIAFLIITVVICKKYTMVYKVTLDGEVLGYVADKDVMQRKIDNYQKDVEENVVSINIPNMPEYELEFVSDIESTDENSVMAKIEEDSEVTCRVYAIKLDDDIKAEVKTKEEADKVVEEIKSDIKSDISLNLDVTEEIRNSKDLEGIIKTSDMAKATINEDVSKKVTEYENKKAQERITVTSRSSTSRGAVATSQIVDKVNTGVFVRPVEGVITSKYGNRSSGFHTGLDIATSLGTPVHPAASGTVIYAGWKGSYGRLVIIDHGNGYQTYYAHCNAIYVNVGEQVTTGTTISTVGTTGNSTGPHLHLEIRINGNTVNPQSYLY